MLSIIWQVRVVDFVHNYLKKSKIALVRHDDAYGDWGQEAVEAQAKTSDVSVIDVESLNANITDVTAAVLQMRAKQPEVIVLFTYPRLAALIIRKAYELGVKSTIVLAATGTADLKALADNVGTKEAFNNLYYQDTINDVPTGPKQKWVHDLYAEKYPDLAKQPGHPSDYFSNDVGGFLEVTYGLMMAGPVPTRENFVKATQTMWFETGSQAGPLYPDTQRPHWRQGNDVPEIRRTDPHYGARYLVFELEIRRQKIGFVKGAAEGLCACGSCLHRGLD